jgi:hypothetical protein
MVNLEELRARGLRAYETGRMRTASRIAVLLIPVAAVCLLETRGREACACLASLLLGLSIWLRWRDRRGTEVVTTGLLAGSIPLVAGLVLARLGFRCDSAGAASFCTTFSLLAGVSAGLWVAFRSTRGHARFWTWFTAGAIAALAASLGCVRLGVVGVASVVFGVAVGTAAAARMAGRAA